MPSIHDLPVCHGVSNSRQSVYRSTAQYPSISVKCTTIKHHMKENAVIKQWNFASVKESTIDQDGLVLSVRSWKNYESLESDIEVS